MTKDEIWLILNRHGIERPAPFVGTGPWVFDDDGRITITGPSYLAGCEVALTTEKIAYVRDDDSLVIKPSKRKS